MKIGFIGLGRMGFNMVRRILEHGHEVVVYNRSREKLIEIEKFGATISDSISDFLSKLPSKKIIWLMLPQGKVTDEHILQISENLSVGDILIDGGNSYYKEDKIRFENLQKKKVEYLDIGVSGGIWGLKNGYAMMIGGNKNAFTCIEPILQSLAPYSNANSEGDKKFGYLYCGKSGSGHFVKMIHNGIEYAMMESYGEGFELLKASEYGNDFNLSEIAKLYQNGSVIRSWLLELLQSALEKDGNLDLIKGYVEDSGEARWTVLEAIEKGVSCDVITQSLFKRFQSRQNEIFSNKIVASLRQEFGGHFTMTTNEQRENIKVGGGEIKHAKSS